MTREPLDYHPDEDLSEWSRTDAAAFLAPAIIAVVSLAIAVGLVVLWSMPARAHDAPKSIAMPLGWKYPYICCSNQDCRQASAGEVREVVTGYLVTASGETVPYGDNRIKDSPDGLFHTCQQAGNFDSGRVLCLFVPPRGF